MSGSMGGEARRGAVALAIVGALAAPAGATLSPEQLVITAIDCDAGVRLRARDVPLSDVLKALATKLGFELKYEGDPGRLVNVDLTRPPVALVSALSPQDSILVTQAPDPRCKGRSRIVKVWVLPAGKAATTPAKTAANDGAAATLRPALPASANERVIRPSPDLDRASQRAKDAYDAHVRAHGRPPDGVPQEEAAP